MSEPIRHTGQDLLAAVSTGAVGGLTAMGLWELTELPAFLAALAAAAAGASVHLAGSATDRLLRQESPD